MDLLNATADYDGQGQAAHRRYGTIKYPTVVECGSGTMTIISTRDSAHDFIVKFSPNMGVAVVAPLTKKMAAQSFAYHSNNY